MPTEKKFDEVEQLFKTASKPKKLIEDIDSITKIGVMYDNTEQGQNALKVASDLANNLNLPIKAYAIDDFHKQMKFVTNEIKNKQTEMYNTINEYTTHQGLKIQSEILVGRKIQKVIDMMETEMAEEEKLSRLLINKLIKENFSIFVAGSPMMRKSEDTGTLGYYLSILLKEHDIHTNFLLVPDKLTDRADLILGFVNFRQIEGTSTALLRRALTIKKRTKQIKIVGIIEESTVETIARSEIDEENTEDFEPKLIEVTERIKQKYKSDLNNMEIADHFDAYFTTEVEVGTLSSLVKIVLEKYKPGTVLVRSVSQLDEHLNPDAELIARIALSEGYPVFILFN